MCCLGNLGKDLACLATFVGTFVSSSQSAYVHGTCVHVHDDHGSSLVCLLNLYFPLADLLKVILHRPRRGVLLQPPGCAPRDAGLLTPTLTVAAGMQLSIHMHGNVVSE